MAGRQVGRQAGRRSARVLDMLCEAESVFANVLFKLALVVFLFRSHPFDSCPEAGNCLAFGVIGHPMALNKHGLRNAGMA